MKPWSPDGSASTDSLLDAAAALLAALPHAADPAAAQEKRVAFERAYRRWLTEHASLAGSGEERMEKLRLVLMAAATAPDLGGAADAIVRFGRIVAPELAPASIEIDGDAAILRFDRARHMGAAGLISELWPLALLLSQLECLAGRPLTGVEGSVRHGPILPEGAIALMFDQPLRFDAGILALHMPARHLRSPVVAQHDELSVFLPRLMADAFGGAISARRREAFPALLRGILRLDRLGGMQMSTLESVAERLGSSPATLRRRLTGEGTSFRELRDTVNNDLARRWLADGTLSVAAVAERLGFSDAYSFARFFARLNGCTPARYRRGAGVSENVAYAGDRDIEGGTAASDKTAR